MERRFALQRSAGFLANLKFGEARLAVLRVGRSEKMSDRSDGEAFTWNLLQRRLLILVKCD